MGFTVYEPQADGGRATGNWNADGGPRKSCGIIGVVFWLIFPESGFVGRAFFPGKRFAFRHNDTLVLENSEGYIVFAHSPMRGLW